MAQYKQKAAFGIALLAACQGKAKRDGVKSFSMRKLSRASGVAQPHLTRCANGDGNLSREVIERICVALGCTPDEELDLYHAARYLAPFEENSNAIHEEMNTAPDEENNNETHAA